MKIYNFDRQSGVFLSESDAEPSPMEPGTFLTPAFATAIPPPSAPAGAVAVFNRSKSRWSVELVAAPAAAPAPPIATFQDKVLAWRVAVTAYANMVAVASDFESMNEAVTYAEEPAVPKFQMQGEALRAWRSLLWQAFDALVTDISGNVATEPTDEVDLRSRLPVYVPPDTSELGIERYVAEALQS